MAIGFDQQLRATLGPRESFFSDGTCLIAIFKGARNRPWQRHDVPPCDCPLGFIGEHEDRPASQDFSLDEPVASSLGGRESR
ncbi:hypothetical protein [Actinoplanes regularis]|uniref:hypothetical protein n=1 Tax=Actinoplanes regularis TaxID=52697 RepID=UPI002552A27C|nr:hypothetical protein [Actinoplanes regularis]